MNDDFSFGLHAVQALLLEHPDRIRELWVQKGRKGGRIEQVVERARELHIPLKFVERSKLDEKSEGVHQGVLARLSAARVYREDDLGVLLDQLDQQGQVPFLLILDGVTDPHNLGACLRSADAAGVQAVIAPRDKAAGLNGVARKVACGAAETVPYVQVTNLARTMEELKARGIWMIGTAGESSENIYTSNLKGPLALVMGAEGKGMRRLTREHCDGLVFLPMAGSVSSLNVSVATGICLFEAVRQRSC